MRRLMALFSIVVAAGVSLGIQPASADDPPLCAPRCIDMGAVQAWGSVSGVGEWESARQNFMNKLAMCDKRGSDSYVEMYLMIRIFDPSAAQPRFIDVPAGNKLFRVREDDPKCVIVAANWRIASSASYEQYAMIEKYRQVKALGGFGEITDAGPWYYTNWDYNPYASCPQCLPPDNELP